MKKFRESLREHAMEIVNIKKKKRKLLTNEQKKSSQNANICYISKEKFEDKHAKDKNYDKVRDHCHYTGEYGGGAHSICNLKYSVPIEIFIALPNRSNYDYHFAPRMLAEELEKQFTCLGKKCWTKYQVPTETNL